MGETSEFTFDGDDFLSNYDFPSTPRSKKTNSSGRLNNLSSQGRIDEEFSTNGRHWQSSTSVAWPASMIYTPGDNPAHNSSILKDIDMEHCNASVVTAVECTMTKYADNLLWVLEGMSGRLSQLESAVYTLNQSTKDLKLSVTNNHGKYSGNLKSLNNHLTEVQRAVQLLRDKQEIFEAHAELVKLQFSTKDACATNSSSGSSVVEAHIQSNNTTQAQDLSPQQPVTLNSTHELQASESNHAQVLTSEHSASVAPTETVMYLNTQPFLPSSQISMQPYVGTHVDVKQSQLRQGPHVQEMQQLLSLPQQSSAQPANFQLQQTQKLQPLSQTPLAQQSLSVHLPPQHVQLMQQPVQPSLSALSTHLEPQHGSVSQLQMQESHPHRPSYWSFQHPAPQSAALPQKLPFQNLPVEKPSVDVLPSHSVNYVGSPQLATQPGNILPLEQHAPLSSQTYNSSLQRDAPSFIVLQYSPPVHDSQVGVYGSQTYTLSQPAIPLRNGLPHFPQT